MSAEGNRANNRQVMNQHKTIVQDHNLSLKITITPLNGSNYITWSKTTSLFLCRKSKMGYVTGGMQERQELVALKTQ
ncbi:hypothetical protein EJ110_NYTH55824 [Nymphaea thermarum]|nr:hypothetical protein EJ110_NYTH55824 [Nymphaea thermarum]